MAEGARLESVWAGNRLVGSNPTLSAIVPGNDVLHSAGVHEFALNGPDIALKL